MAVSTVIPTLSTSIPAEVDLLNKFDELMIRLNRCEYIADKKEKYRLANIHKDELFQLFAKNTSFGCTYFLKSSAYYDKDSLPGQVILIILRYMADEKQELSSIYALAELYRINYAPCVSHTIHLKTRGFYIREYTDYYRLGQSLGCKRCESRVNETEAFAYAQKVLTRMCSDNGLRLKRDFEQLTIMREIVIDRHRADLLPTYIRWLEFFERYTELVAICDYYAEDIPSKTYQNLLLQRRDMYKKKARVQSFTYYTYKAFCYASYIVPIILCIVYANKLPLAVNLSMGVIVYLILSYLAPAPLRPFKTFFSVIFGGIAGAANDDDLFDAILISSLL